MKYFMLLLALLGTSSLIVADGTVDNQAVPITSNITKVEKVLSTTSSVRISVVGQGVAPMNTSSPAQAYALAKRAATADAYRLIAEKVKGVRIDGQDLIKNMMVKRSIVRTSVQAMVRNANVVETTFKEGLCEVEMEILLSHSDFAQ
ncbi:MAG: LPP20 family lipoprotein [Sulfurimonas sp.]|nr:LPP20 family lipoprotein [Sulfurimonas sp.]